MINYIYLLQQDWQNNLNSSPYTVGFATTITEAISWVNNTTDNNIDNRSYVKQTRRTVNWD